MEIKSYEEFQFKDDIVGIDDVSITYIQNEDCTGLDGETPQTITISTRNNAVERFINIKTDSWSISDVDELVKLIEDFKKRAELCGGDC